MYFKISLLLLFLTIVTTVKSQDDIPDYQKTVSWKCSDILSRYSSDSPEYEIIHTRSSCRPDMEEYYDCMLANIYKSNFTSDIETRSQIDYSRVKAATRKMCKDARKIKFKRLTGEFPLLSKSKCRGYAIWQSGPIKDSALFCRNSFIRCRTRDFSEYHLQESIVYAKYEFESLNNGCLLSDPKFQLFPTYGPELKCYSSINIDHIQRTDYSRIYESYCNQFNYTAVSTCIQETLTLSNNVTSIDLWEDKESYIKKATQFLNDRHTLCNEMATIASFKCMNPTYKPNVDLCQQPMFLPPGPSKYNVSDATKMYALCIKLIYAPCNFDLGQLIYRNMMTYIQ